MKHLKIYYHGGGEEEAICSMYEFSGGTLVMYNVTLFGGTRHPMLSVRTYERIEEIDTKAQIAA